MKPLQIAVFFSSFALLGALVDAQTLPDPSTPYFAGSGVCATCHNGLRDSSGEDVSIAVDWQSTMMANAANDPLWQMKVYSETIRNPTLSSVIQDKCSTCHMPMARSQLIFENSDVEMWGEGLLNEKNNLYHLAMDGVSCTLCHQIAAENLGLESSFSGHFIIDAVTERPARKIYGPYTDPVATPMRNSSSFTPAFSEHVEDSRLCATCHTLYTPVIDNEGDHISDFPEQTPFLEWKESVYAREPDRIRSCQDCHMPTAKGGAVISNRPPQRLTSRSPFFKHFFVGGNVVMLEVFSAFNDKLGLTATTQSIDNTKDRTLYQLQNNTATIEIQNIKTNGTALTIDVRVRNNTGHKFPTGFPSRRAWIHIKVEDADRSIVFESGRPKGEGAIFGNDADSSSERFERHYSTIRDEQEVQIYELIMGDLIGDLTYTLLDAANRIKDNRLLPDGFVKGKAEVDVEVVGKAVSDIDFNGGSDSISYRIPIKVVKFPLEISAALLYQTVSYRFWRDLIIEADVRESLDNDSIRFLGDYNEPVVVSSVFMSID
jgi:hypothetical protein